MKTGTTALVAEKQQPLAIPEERALLINISETGLGIKERTYGVYTIRGRARGERYAKLVIPAARAVIDRGDNHKEYFIIHANEIAEDLARECNRDIWGMGSAVIGQVLAGKNIEASVEETALPADVSESGEIVRGFAGVFVAEHPEGSKGFEAELEEAQRLLNLSDEILVTAGHSTYDQFPNRPDMLHEGFKRAARRLGVDAEWLYRVQSGLPDCPHCGSKLKSHKATVCATCGRDVVTQAQAQSEAPRNKPGRRAKAAA